MGMNPAILAKLREAKAKFASRGDSKFFKIKEGKTTIRIITGKIGSRTDLDPALFYREVGVHWIKETEDGKPVAVVGCHEVIKGEPCPTCNAIDKAGPASSDDDMLALVKTWKPRKNVLVLAMIRSGSEASEEKAQIVELSPSTFSDVCNVLETYGSEEFDPLDHQTGLDLIIERTGKGKNDTKYKVLPAPGKSKPVPKHVFDDLPDLDMVIEREYFRGEDPKALRAIGSITGANVTSLMPKAKAPALTSRSTAVEGADEMERAAEVVAAKPAAAAKPTVTKAAAKPAPAPEPDANVDLSDQEVADVLGELDGLLDEN